MAIRAKVPACLVMILLLTASIVLFPQAVPTVQADPIGEVEPNDTFATAQSLANIGMDNPVVAAVNSPGDIDWFSFSATAGHTYVLELSNVSRALGGSGDGCDGIWSYDGVGLSLFDQGQAQIVEQCDAYGAGNVHNIIQFTAGLDGAYYIRITANDTAATGHYYLRVLPKYDETGAGWDPLTFEPNNVLANAYAITPGWTNALTSRIEARDRIYSTFTSDRDWYRFQGTAGHTYVVELFNVSSSLGGNGSECDGTWSYDGVGLMIYDQAGTQIAKQCDAYGTGNVHNSVQFAAGLDGMYYIRVVPNKATDSGYYSIRVLPKHGEPGAGWNPVTFEPNNATWNAYAISLGSQNALASEITVRKSGYSTFTSDRDWYRFDGVAGHTYTVELYDVTSSLGGNGDECDGTWSYNGVGLLVYDKTGTQVAKQCNPSGGGTVHNRVQFAAGIDGVFYVGVYPNSTTDSGQYSLRVCEGACAQGASMPAPRVQEASLDNSPAQVVLQKVALAGIEVPSQVPLAREIAPFATISETEPNNTWDTAQFLETIGRDSPVSAAINPAGDVDWYTFTVVAGRTYVVELFNVSSSLGGSGDGCDGIWSYDGVGLLAYDSSVNQIARQCDAYGTGNVHNIIQFTAGLDGVYYLHVVANNAAATGHYYLRILPEHDESGAGWDPSTFEPNNALANAYTITPGLATSLTSEIEPRNSIYSTFTSDRDWYHFEAVAGRTYVVELFNVPTSLGGSGDECDGTWSYNGVGLMIHDQAGVEVARRCDAFGVGNIHNGVSFAAGLDGTYYIRVIPNSPADSGYYSIRVLPKHDEPMSRWDAATFEPNNIIWNAYTITLGCQNALTSRIEERNPLYSSSTSDRDVYRFEGIPWHTYVVELFNVDGSLGGSGDECDGTWTYDGVGLRAYNRSGYLVARQCNPSGSGKVHNRTQFTAGIDGVFYVDVCPNSTASYGQYSLRVCENSCLISTYLPLIYRY